MKNALIGYSGFVGGNLLSQMPFSHLYNSKNIEEIDGHEFDLLVCAGAPAVKWWANQNPEADRATIQRLIDNLAKVRARHVILISTIDVYRDIHQGDEGTPIRHEGLHPYGLHRAMLEEFCQMHFPGALIVRLPGLFGIGLKKNIIHDLMHGHLLDKINPASTYQYYPLRRLSADLQVAQSSAQKVFNFFTEPLATQTLTNLFFPSLAYGAQPAPEVHYDLTTQHASLWGYKRYMMNQSEVLGELGHYLTSERK